MSLQHLVDAFAGLPQMTAVHDALRARQHRAVGGLWGASSGLLLAALAEAGRLGQPLLVVTGNDDDSAQLGRDLAAYGVARALTLNAQVIDVEGRPEGHSLSQKHVPHSGGPAPRAARRAPPFVLLCSIEALLHPVPDPRGLGGKRLDLRVGS